MQTYFIQDMDPEKTPLLSTAKETINGTWDEKTAVPYTQRVICSPFPAGTQETAQETAQTKSHNTEELQLPFLVPLKTQLLYWTASAGVVVCGQAIRRVVALHHLIGPVLLVLVAACLVHIIIMDARGRPLFRTLPSDQEEVDEQTREIFRTTLPRIFIIGLAMLVSAEIMWPLLRLINDVVSQYSTPPLTSPQDYAVRFCFAYIVLEFHDRRMRTDSHVIIPDDTWRASAWCEPPYFTHLQVPGRGQAVWKRRDKMRGIRHGTLAWCLTSVLARLVAYVLGVPATAVWCQLWGLGCLGVTHVLLGILLLRPMHALVLWLCDRILYGFGRLLGWWTAL